MVVDQCIACTRGANLRFMSIMAYIVCVYTSIDCGMLDSDKHTIKNMLMCMEVTNTSWFFISRNHVCTHPYPVLQ